VDKNSMTHFPFSLSYDLEAKNVSIFRSVRCNNFGPPLYIQHWCIWHQILTDGQKCSSEATTRRSLIKRQTGSGAGIGRCGC